MPDFVAMIFTNFYPPRDSTSEHLNWIYYSVQWYVVILWYLHVL